MRGVRLKTVLLFVDNYFSSLKILWLSLVLSYHCYRKICGTFPFIRLALYGSIISHVFIQFGEVLFYYYLVSFPISPNLLKSLFLGNV